MSDNKEYMPIYVPVEKPSTIVNPIIKGKSNGVDDSAINIYVSGYANSVGQKCRDVTILNSSGCTVMPGVIGATIINSSGVVVTEDNYLCINNTQIKSTGYKVYRANLYQAGVSDPTKTVLENTFSDEIVFTYSGTPGIYIGTLAGAFPTASKFSNFIAQTDASNPFKVVWNDIDSFLIHTGVDGVLQFTTIEIMQYN